MVNVLKFGYNDVMAMPVYERRFYIEKHKEFNEVRNNLMSEKIKDTSKGKSVSYSPGINGPKLN